MTVRGFPPQRAQNEEIECALEELDSTQASFGRHSRWNDMSTHLEGQGGSQSELQMRRRSGSATLVPSTRQQLSLNY
jgi:hypothetical protein